MKRRLLFLAILVPLVVAGLVGGALWLDYRAFLDEPLPAREAEPYFVIPKGTSLRGVAERLVADGHLRQPYYFLALAHLSDQAARIQAGEYGWPPGTRPADLLARFASGRVVQHSITLVEGRTFRQAVAALVADERLAGELAGLDDGEIMARLGRPDDHPEGRFFPDTYSFPRDTERLAVLRRALARMDEVLAAEWAERAADLPLATPYEALILASIIEKETGRAGERAEIAGVFVRRLRRGMRLQTDPTVIYGLGEDYDGRLRKVDLRTDTPYNTYVRHGLPPTPIALPGRAALHAALHPADGEALYFVSKGDGSHHFSATLSEHNRAVRRYILGQGEVDPATRGDM